MASRDPRVGPGQKCGCTPGRPMATSFWPKGAGLGIRGLCPVAGGKTMITRLFTRPLIVALLALCTGLPVRVGAQANPAIVALDPAFSRIVPDGAQIEKLAG